MKTVILGVTANDILNLRHKVLRPNLPIETSRYEGDDEMNTVHFATYLTDEYDHKTGEPICCATFMIRNLGGIPGWKLHGMAITQEYQGQGLGKELLSYTENFLNRCNTLRRFWCNARMSAAGFYRKHGWRSISKPFEVPNAGLHLRMLKTIPPRIY